MKPPERKRKPKAGTRVPIREAQIDWIKAEGAVTAEDLKNLLLGVNEDVQNMYANTGSNTASGDIAHLHIGKLGDNGSYGWSAFTEAERKYYLALLKDLVMVRYG